MRITITPPPRVDVRRFSEEVQRAVAASLEAGAVLVANDAKRSIAQGPKTGRVYEYRYKTNRATGGIFPVEKRSVPHQASAPGQPPATDEGRLVGSIVSDAIDTKGEGLVAIVEAQTEYAKFLEYGTKRMAPRPFMLPAFERNRQRIADLIRLSIATAASRFARKAGRRT